MFCLAWYARAAWGRGDVDLLVVDDQVDLLGEAPEGPTQRIPTNIGPLSLVLLAPAASSRESVEASHPPPPRANARATAVQCTLGARALDRTRSHVAWRVPWVSLMNHHLAVSMAKTLRRVNDRFGPQLSTLPRRWVRPRRKRRIA